MALAPGRLEPGLAAALVVSAPMALRWEVIPRQSSQLNRDLTGGLVYLSDVALLLLVGSFLLRSSSRDRPLRLGPRAVGLPLIALTALPSLSVAWAPSRAVAADAALHLIALLGLYVVLVNAGPAGRWTVPALIASGAAEGALAVGQFLLQQPLGLGALGEVDLIAWASDVCVRPGGLSPNPNILGGYLAVSVLAALGLSAPTWPRRLGVGLALGLMLGGLLTTGSRTALLALFVGLAVLLLGRYGLPGRRWLVPELATAAVVALIVGVTLGGCVAQRVAAPVSGIAAGLDGSTVATTPDPSAGRWELLAVAGLLTAEHPFGVGVGNFTLAWLLRGEPAPSRQVYQPVHNVAALVAAEIGFFGAFAWVALWVGVVLTVRRRRPLDRWQTVWSSALAALFVVGLFDFYPWGWEQGRVLFTLVLGLWARTISTAKEARHA